MTLRTIPSISSLLFMERAEQADIIKRSIESGVFLSTKTGKPVKVNSLDSFNRYLRQQHGRVQVGQGYYSTAYVGGEGLSTAEYVLKVKRRERAWTSDLWFDVYGPYCYENKPTNPLFPKVLYVGQPSWSDQPIALVEKLRFDYSIVEEHVLRIFKLTGVRTAMHNAVELYSGTRTLRTSSMGADAAEDFKLGFNLLLKQLGSNPKDFTEFATAMASMTDLRNLDIHGNNMGWRANGELVISDPIA